MPSYSRNFAPSLNSAPLLIFDRDGTLNENNTDHPHKLEDLKVREGIPKLFSRLEKLRVNIAIATNQSGIARELYSEAEFEFFNSELITRIGVPSTTINLIAACFHHPNLECQCRKPKPGLLEHCKAQFPSSAHVLFTGDAKTDKQAAKNAYVDWIDINDFNSSQRIISWVESHNDL